MMVGCYLRVSTDDQDQANQRPDLERLCEARNWTPKWYEDHGLSGMTTNRPAYESLMEDARLGRIRAVVVWKFDRLGRTVLQLVSDLDALDKYGVALVSARDPVDTTTPAGRAMFGMIAVFAQMERDGISERTKAAYEARKARAKSLGQKPRWGRRGTPVHPTALMLARQGMAASAIARTLGISRRQATKAVEAARNGGVPDAGPVSPDEPTGTKSGDSGQEVGL